jgi:hypothetical protein
MSAFHQPCVGDETAKRGETIDVVDNVRESPGLGFFLYRGYRVANILRVCRHRSRINVELCNIS